MTVYHAENGDIGYVTAVSDLKRLAEAGFLTKTKAGRNVYYRPAPKIHTLIK